MIRPNPLNTRNILLAIILFSLAIRLPALFIPHIEGDEVIYQALVDKVSHSFSLKDYTLQGTPIFSQLPASVYDYPLFRYPPLFIFTLALLKNILGATFEILLPIVSGVLIIVVTYLIAKRLYSQEHGLMAALIISFCPIIWLTSTKIWMETTFIFLMALSFYLLLFAAQRQDWRYFGLAGLIFGFSLLTKPIPLGMLPAIIYYFWRQRFSFKNLIVFSFCFFIVALLINLPWLFYYYKSMGTLSYVNQFRLTPEYTEIPFVKMTMNRPYYYYFVTLPLIFPLHFFSWASIFNSIKEKRDLSVAIWFLSFILGITFLGIKVLRGFNMRALAPFSPASAILAADLVIRNKRMFYPILVISLAYGLFTGFLNTYIFRSADVFPITHFLPFLFTVK